MIRTWHRLRAFPARGEHPRAIEVLVEEHPVNAGKVGVAGVDVDVRQIGTFRDRCPDYRGDIGGDRHRGQSFQQKERMMVDGRDRLTVDLAGNDHVPSWTEVSLDLDLGVPADKLVPIIPARFRRCGTDERERTEKRCQHNHRKKGAPNEMKLDDLASSTLSPPLKT